MITVDEIMSTNLETLKEVDTLETAARLMADNGIRHLPVLNDDGSLVGLVTQRDVLKSASVAANPGSVPCSEFMTRDVDTVDERTGLRQAAIYLQKHKYGCLPVVTGGKLKGIVTDSDFVGVAINLLEQLEIAEPEEV